MLVRAHITPNRTFRTTRHLIHKTRLNAGRAQRCSGKHDFEHVQITAGPSPVRRRRYGVVTDSDGLRSVISSVTNGSDASPNCRTALTVALASEYVVSSCSEAS